MYVIHALIPARGGSKSIPRKNIIDFNGHPLIATTIHQALRIKRISRVVVSTDSDEIKEVSLRNGAEVPFLRPPEISGDLSSDIDCFTHYLDWLRSRNQILPDVIIHLRPTSPNRDPDLINQCLDAFLSSPNKPTSLRTVIVIEKSLFKMYTEDEEGLIHPPFQQLKHVREPHNQPRQILPRTLLHNGYVDIVARSTIESGSMTGRRIMPFIMDQAHVHDIDTHLDLRNALVATAPDAAGIEVGQTDPVKPEVGWDGVGCRGQGAGQVVPTSAAHQEEDKPAENNSRHGRNRIELADSRENKKNAQDDGDDD